MALARNTGQPDCVPALPLTSNISSTTSLLIDAVTERVGVTGRVWWPGAGDTKNIQNIAFITGAVSTPSGTVEFSIQDTSGTSNGGVPDGTVDQSASTSTFPGANTEFKSGNLSANRAVTRGQLLSFVLGSTAWNSGSFNILTLASFSGAGLNSVFVRLYSGGAWGDPSNKIPIIKLYFDDGTEGTVLGAWWGTGAQESFGSGASPNERGNRFVLPYACEVEGVQKQFAMTAYDRDYEIKIYRGTTALETITVDATTKYQGGVYPDIYPFTTRHSFAANETFYVTIKPTTAGAVELPVATVPVAGDLALLPGGTSVQYATFTAGTPTVTATKRAMLSVLCSAFDDGAGAGGLPRGSQLVRAPSGLLRV